MPRSRLSITQDSFWRLAILVLVLRVLPAPAGFLAYVIVMLYGLRGGRHAIEAILLSWYLTLANAAIFGEVIGGTIGRFMVIFGVAAAVMMKQKARRGGAEVQATVVLGAFILLHSLLFSSVTTISFLKGIMWSLSVLSMVIAFNSLSEDEFRITEQHIYSFLALLVFLCIPTYMLLPEATMPGYSYLRGMLSHSQATGVLASLVAVWAFSRIIDGQHGTSREFLILGLGLVTAFLSGSRTGLLSVVLCAIGITLMASYQGRRPLQHLIKGASNPLVTFGLAAMFVAAILNSGTLMNSLSDFLDKNSRAESLAAAFDDSRGNLVETMMENIREDPLVGIGFGIASNPREMIVEEMGGIPISAVVEKGVTYLAVWEELGLLGVILFIYWVLAVLSKAKSADLAQLGLLLCILFQNVAEASLFSAGGNGLLQILLIGYASYRVKRWGLRRQTPASLQPKFYARHAVGKK